MFQLHWTRMAGCSGSDLDAMVLEDKTVCGPCESTDLIVPKIDCIASLRQSSSVPHLPIHPSHVPYQPMALAYPALQLFYLLPGAQGSPPVLLPVISSLPHKQPLFLPPLTSGAAQTNLEVTTGVSIISKNWVFDKGWYLRLEFFIRRVFFFWKYISGLKRIQYQCKGKIMIALNRAKLLRHRNTFCSKVTVIFCNLVFMESYSIVSSSIGIDGNQIISTEPSWNQKIAREPSWDQEVQKSQQVLHGNKFGLSHSDVEQVRSMWSRAPGWVQQQNLSAG